MAVSPFLFEKYTLAVFFFSLEALNTQWSYLNESIEFESIFGIILFIRYRLEPI